MITLTAQMRIQSENPLPFALGVSELGGGALFGETIDVEAVFDRRNLLSLESNIIDRSDTQLPSFGIISNGGSLSFKDNNSRFLGYANAGLLKEGIQIAIYINDTIKKSKSIVGTYFSTDWEYDNDNNSVSVRFKDDIEEWQSIQVDAIPLQNRMTLEGIYYHLKSKTPSKFIFNEESLPAERLQTICAFPYLESGTLWSQWQKLCEACGMCIYKNEKNEVCFSNSFDIGI